MEDLNEEEYFLEEEQLPEIDPVWLEKTNTEIKELLEQIPIVAKQPSTEKIWCKTKSFWYGHPVTPLILRCRALLWLLENPPDPRGEKFAKRDGPYYVYIFVKEFALAIRKSERTLERMLKMTREAAGKGPREKITVEYFCFLHGYPEDEIQQNLHEIFMGRWNKYKKKHKPNTKDDD